MINFDLGPWMGLLALLVWGAILIQEWVGIHPTRYTNPFLVIWRFILLVPMIAVFLIAKLLVWLSFKESKTQFYEFYD